MKKNQELKKMIELGMFTWNGTTEELKSYADEYAKACEKHGLKFIGVYAPLQEPYHYAFAVDNKMQNRDGFDKPFRETGMKHPKVGVWIYKNYAKMEW